jgi:hypothetical protein
VDRPPASECQSRSSPDQHDCDDKDPEDPDDRATVPVRRSSDPNDLTGPNGFGADRFVSADKTLDYAIRFENDPIFATAPAQTVQITQKLDNDLDFRSFRLGAFGFGATFVDVPEGSAFYQGRLDLTSSFGIFCRRLSGHRRRLR